MKAGLFVLIGAAITMLLFSAMRVDADCENTVVELTAESFSTVVGGEKPALGTKNIYY